MCIECCVNIMNQLKGYCEVFTFFIWWIIIYLFLKSSGVYNLRFCDLLSNHVYANGIYLFHIVNYNIFFLNSNGVYNLRFCDLLSNHVYANNDNLRFCDLLSNHVYANNDAKGLYTKKSSLELYYSFNDH